MSILKGLKSPDLYKNPELTKLLSYDRFNEFVMWQLFMNPVCIGADKVIEMAKDKGYDLVCGDFLQASRHIASRLDCAYFQTHSRITYEHRDRSWTNISFDQLLAFKKWAGKTHQKQALYNYYENFFAGSCYGTCEQFVWERWLLYDKAQPRFLQPAIILTSPMNYCVTIPDCKDFPHDQWRDVFKHAASRSFIWIGNRDFDEKREYGRKDVYSFTESLKPRLYVSLGTAFNNNFPLWDCLIKALEKLNYPTVCTAGNSQKLLDHMKGVITSDNIVCELYVNQRAYLCETDIYFCHGGASSTYEALYYTTPVVMFPQNGDQFNNAHLMEKSGCGPVIMDQKDAHGNQDNMIDTIIEATNNVVNNFQSYKKSTIEYKDSFMECMNTKEGCQQMIDMV